jgi:hypothetical protein
MPKPVAVFSSLSKSLVTAILVVASTLVARCQHFNWKVSLTNGMEIDHVHPDSVCNDSLAVSSSNSDISWFCLDSIRSITYDYNPAIVTFTIIGGVMGSTVGLDDPNAARILIGMASGVAIGYLTGEAMGVSDEIAIAALDPSQRADVLRKSVARWSGRVKVVSR